ncbi:zf-HC2 domain-containing protein, partial [Micromonospora sp. NPDC000207]|uniref:zf-HC2 domain-containing protein n=1 Tax=Micromonospora sp. NPDC000207 TaxID=3154246 RepID=UPI00331F38A1
MGCEGWREILSAQLDGEETPTERVAVQRHLEGCAGCRSWLDLVAGVNRRARTQVVPTVPDLTEAILAAAAPPATGRRWRPPRPPPPRLPSPAPRG